MTGASMLSGYPATKIIVECEQCGLRAKYDRLEMLEAGGDRPLSMLLGEIARRHGCDNFDPSRMRDWCKAKYANLPPEKSDAPNAYARAKGR
jgi:hypothetical protein